MRQARTRGSALRVGGIGVRAADETADSARVLLA